MRMAHLAASAFVGGPESQLLGLIAHLPAADRSAVFSFSEGGRCRALLDQARRLNAEAVELIHNAPHYRQAVREVADHLRRFDADVLCCHGYKPDLLGLFAARRGRVPVVSVSHGWTAATFKVRLNEFADRLCLHGMNRVVCVSEAQARRVRNAGIASQKIIVIRNAIDPERSRNFDPSVRAELLSLFPTPPRVLIGAAGRLSPEKGYGVLVDAAVAVLRDCPDAGFLHFGDGPLRAELETKAKRLGLSDRFVFGGFRTDLARVLPNLDLFVLPSFTEGLPVVVLEAFSAGVPVVATAVGGTPEVITDGESGRLVPPGDPAALAREISRLVQDHEMRNGFVSRGRAVARERFSFATQAIAYQSLFEGLTAERSNRVRLPSIPSA